MSSTSENFEELLYTQRLADVSDKVRGQTIKKLKTFLRIKSSTTGFNYEDFLKIWKGLYYCMYMADKPLFQEDLAESISKLLHHLSDSSQKLLFFKVALDTFAREWSGIDKFRMDKFLMLVTRVLRQLLIFLCGNSWNKAEVKEASDLLESRIICPFDRTSEKPLGLKMHLADIILEELAKVGKESLPDEVLITLVFPFLKVLAISNDKIYVNAIKNRILVALIRQSELGLENQEDLSLRELEVVKDEEAEQESVEDEEMDFEQDKENEFVMDPRAGGVDVQLPLLRPDYNKIAEALLALASLQEVPRRKKNFLRKQAENFTTLAKEKYPFSFPEVEDSAPKSHLVKKALKSLQELENKKPSRKRDLEDDTKDEKKTGPKKIKFSEIEESLISKVDEKKLKNIKRMEKLRQKNIMRKRRGITKKSFGKKERAKEQNNKIAHNQAALKQKLKMLSDNIGNKPSAPSLQQDPKNNLKMENEMENGNNIEQKTKIKKKKKKSTKNVSSIQSPEHQIPTSDCIKQKENTKMKSTKQPKFISKSLDNSPNIESKKRKVKRLKIINKETHVTNGLKQKVKVKNIIENCNEELNNSIKLKRKQANLKIKGNIKENSKKKMVKSDINEKKCSKKSKVKKDPWSESLEEGEIEFEVPSKKYAKKLKERPTPIMKKSPKVNKSGRTLKINLRNNKEHEFKDYKRAIASRPGIPYSSYKKPAASVLKPSPSPNLVKKSCISKINKLKKKYKL